MKKQRINLYVDADTWREFRAACVLRKQSASEVAEWMMAEQLRRWAADPVVRSSVRSDTPGAAENVPKARKSAKK